jgi:hypothetical protein
MGIGDDQLWFLEGNWNDKNIKWITNIVVEEFDKAGLPGNAEKQEVSLTKTTFLQRLCTSQWNGSQSDVVAAGVYSLVRNLTSQVFPERYHNEKDWDKYMFALRVIMIAENCNQHPLFAWYVKFCLNSNENVKEFVQLKDAVICRIQERAKKISNFLPTYNQEKQDQNILTFDTLKIMRTLVNKEEGDEYHERK